MTMSQYQLNLVADFLYREQAYDPPATRYVGLFTVAPTRSTSGTELTTGAGFTGYARQSYVGSLTNYSGTQGAGTTAVSSGSGAGADRISNNVAVSFSAALAAAWTGLAYWGLFDASTAGNLLEFGPIVDSAGTPITRSFAIGDPVVFAPGTLLLILS